MGLAERRATKAFQESRYPKLKAEIDQLAGYPLELEVQWDNLSVEDYSELYDDAWVKVYFKPLIEALKAIVVDDLGKEALKEGLQKVIITHSGSQDVSFKGGVLRIDYYPVSNLDYWADRKETIQKILEKGL